MTYGVKITILLEFGIKRYNKTMGRTRDTSKIFTTVENIDVTDQLNSLISVGSASPSTDTKIWIDTTTASAPIIKTFSDSLWRGSRLSNLDSPIVATGGSISTISQNGTSYKVHTFTSTSNFNIVSGEGIVEYLVLAGGGAGGGSNQDVTGNTGGGGAGGYLEGSTNVSAGVHTVVVGAGGSRVSATVGGDGSVSGFNNIQSTGGGGGGGLNSYNGRTGGSGGGRGFTGSPGVGVSGQGFTPTGSGGGGSNGIGDPDTYGGNGTTSSIDGTATTRAGGGGSGRSNQSGGSLSNGGFGGGGYGVAGDGGTAGSGSTNTGSGGGGGGKRSGLGEQLPGNGGSGIVIIRYLT